MPFFKKKAQQQEFLQKPQEDEEEEDYSEIIIHFEGDTINLDYSEDVYNNIRDAMVEGRDYRNEELVINTKKITYIERQ